MMKDIFKQITKNSTSLKINNKEFIIIRRTDISNMVLINKYLHYKKIKGLATALGKFLQEYQHQELPNKKYLNIDEESSLFELNSKNIFEINHNGSNFFIIDKIYKKELENELDHMIKEWENILLGSVETTIGWTFSSHELRERIAQHREKRKNSLLIEKL